MSESMLHLRDTDGNIVGTVTITQFKAGVDADAADYLTDEARDAIERELPDGQVVRNG